MAHPSTRDIDILIYGATGFTGQLVADYMQQHYRRAGLTWALGGRDQRKLEAVARRLAGDSGEGPDIFVADSGDPQRLSELVARTRVVLTTVGPYARYGSPLVAACAALGTDYCDLTGEVQWMQQMIAQHQASAIASGARIVHTCGFDSIPSDLGVYRLVDEMSVRHGCTPVRVKYRMRDASGGFSGGTFDSLVTMAEQAAADPSIRAIVDDPYALNPPDQPRGPDGPEATMPAWDEDFDGWVGPFVMAPINTRVVRRSNALMNFRYGPDFRYDEAMLLPWGSWGWFAAAALSFGMGAIHAMARFGPTRSVLRALGPKPGTGPSEAQQRRGFFDVELLAEHPTDRTKDLRLTIHGDRDPGYGSTSRMIAECAVCLASDAPTCGGGFWTPASAMGDHLLERLPRNAGVSFELAPAGRT
ncbi:MAG: saccharopine dehydrogenase NADP-binding domain-containing protein [Myxococcota bacterium]